MVVKVKKLLLENGIVMNLKSTTLGLVGNECKKTQLVYMVGMMYNLPSIVQSIGRIRPSQRNNESTCSIFTSDNNSEIMRVARNVVNNLFCELVGCKVMSKDNKVKYFHSMSMASVNNWLFDILDCRMVSLSKQLGYEQGICELCDTCTNTNMRKSSFVKLRQIDIDKKQRKMELGY